MHDAVRRAALVAVLVNAGSSGVVEDGPSLVAYLPEDTDQAAVGASLASADDTATIELSTAVPDNWVHRWREGVHAHEVGLLRVSPPWLADAADDTRTVVIDPGMGFGTGEHASTRGVLRLLSSLDRMGHLVADLGAGSGVLAIAAAKLGAARVAAIEMDPDAIANAQSNVEANRVADRVRVIAGDARDLLPLLAPVDLVTMNITSPVIRELLPIVRAALVPKGRAILGGMLLDEREEMCVHLAANGLRREADDVEDDWWATIAARP
jgi:ribosomal protein L11 methyltransferase